MAKMFFIEEAKEIANFWGDKMPMMAMEEMAELTKAISKIERKGESEDRLAELIDEIGDVYISLSAIMARYEIFEEDVNRRIENKVNKKYQNKNE